MVDEKLGDPKESERSFIYSQPLSDEWSFIPAHAKVSHAK